MRAASERIIAELRQEITDLKKRVDGLAVVNVDGQDINRLRYMLGLALFQENRMMELYHAMWSVVAQRNQIVIDQAKWKYNILTLKPEHFDDLRESEYSYDWSYDGAHETFRMERVTTEVVGIYGWSGGDLDGHIDHVRIWINHRKIREYAGLEFPSDRNMPYVFTDPCYASKTQRLRIDVHTTGASKESRAFPRGWVISPR